VVLVPDWLMLHNVTGVSAASQHCGRPPLAARGSLGKTHLVSWQGGLVTVRGVLQVHSAPPALSPHIEWAVAGIFGVPVKLYWIEQPAAPGTVRTELAWQGRPGTSAAIASALAAWKLLRFEVSEDASPGCDAVRYSSTPSLGTFLATISANGDIMISENRLRAALTLAAAAQHPGHGRRQDAGLDTDQLGTLRELHGPRHPALGGSLEAELALLLGDAWDAELEPFRHASAGAPVRWLHAVG